MTSCLFIVYCSSDGVSPLGGNDVVPPAAPEVPRGVPPAAADVPRGVPPAAADVPRGIPPAVYPPAGRDFS